MTVPDHLEDCDVQAFLEKYIDDEALYGRAMARVEEEVVETMTRLLLGALGEEGVRRLAARRIGVFIENGETTDEWERRRKRRNGIPTDGDSDKGKDEDPCSDLKKALRRLLEG